MPEAYVHNHTDHHSGITSIEFFHSQGNSLPGNLLNQLTQEIHHAGLNPDTKVIILRSGGDKAFCGGASFAELAAIRTEEQGQAFFSGFAHVINAMRTCSKLVIARVHGRCVGGGVGIVAAADYAIATEAAEIKLSELTIGIGPFVVGPAIERKIGAAAFSHLAIDAAMWRNADWARRKGLYAELHENNEGMDESLSRLAHELAHSSTEAMTAMKKMFWQGTENWEHLLKQRAAISGRLVTAKDSREAIARMISHQKEKKGS